MKNTQRVIVVLGVYRSGTSALTKGLGAMGVRLPDASKICYNKFNEKGSWEDPDFCALDGDMLKALNAQKHRIRQMIPVSEEEIVFLCQQGFVEKAAKLVREKVVEGNAFGVKDPKFCLLLPFWKKVFEICNVRVSFVIALRNPLSVVASIEASQKFLGEQEQEKSFWVWISYLLNCLEHTEGEECLLVDYDELIKNPARQVERMARTFDLEIEEDSLQAYSDEFIDRSLRHFHQEENCFFENSFCRSFSSEIYHALLQVAKEECDIQSLKNLFKKWREQFLIADSLLVLAEKKEYDVDQLRKLIQEREQTILSLSQSSHQQLNNMMNFYNTVHQQNLQMASLIVTNERKFPGAALP